MKRLFIVLLLAFGVCPAFAQEADETPRRLNTMSLREREHELEQQNFQGASGFWTSPHRSTHGAYRYRLMLIGCALVLGTGLVVARLIKKANLERTARNMGKLGRDKDQAAASKADQKADKKADESAKKADQTAVASPGSSEPPRAADDDTKPPSDSDQPPA